jgi:hypothetical protein
LLLSTRGKRPCYRRRAEKFDELAPLHCRPATFLDRGIVAVHMRVVKACLMSALGQKRTCALQIVMSVLHPKADMCGALTSQASSIY